MRFGDLLAFRKDIFFDGAVQIDWFYNKEKATLVAENFVFHGQEYHGVEGSRGSNLKDTVQFVYELSDKFNEEYNSNPLSLAIATYGTGKSHLAVTLAELFSGPDYNPQAYNAIIKNISTIDEQKAQLIKQNTQRRSLVLTINGMKDINLNAELLKSAQKSLLLYGCSTENLKKINRALETAYRFFERNSSSYGLFEKHAEKFGFRQKGEALINVIKDTLYQKSETFDLVNAAYNDINGSDISWEEGISATSILNGLLEDYCSASGPFDGIVILFDEFGRYLEYASSNSSAKTGESALQQIFECAQNAEGRIQVVNFIQSEIKTYLQRIDSTSNITRYIGRYDASDKYHLSSNLETIFANLVLRKDKTAFSKIIGSYLQNEEGYWKEIYDSLTKWTNTKGIWKYYDKYRKVIVQGIYPLHPMSTFALSQLSSYLQNRSSLSLVNEYFEKLKDEEIAEGQRLPFIYPEQLLNGDLFYEILSAEESGRQQSQYCLALNKILSKYKDKLNENCLKVLRANLLLRVLRFKTIDRTGVLNALNIFSGLSISEIEEALHWLETEYAILGFNEHVGCFDFLEDSTGAHDFRVFFKRMRADIKISKDIFNDSSIRELADIIGCQTTRFSIDKKIKTKEWQYEQEMFYIDEISVGYVNNLIRECKEAISPDKAKGKLIWLYTNKNMDVSYVDEVKKLALRAKTLPIVFMLLNDSECKLENAFIDYKALKKFKQQDISKYQMFYNDMLDSVNNSISDIFEELKGERICINESGVISLEERLPIYLSKVFHEIYPKAISFDFDGFDVTKGKARTYFCNILRVLFSGQINEPAVNALGPDALRRLKNTLGCSSLNSWKCMNDNYQIIVPQVAEVEEVYNEISQRLVIDTPISYQKFLDVLVKPPYGLNDHEVLYLTAIVYANLSYCLRIVLNGRQITAAEWLNQVIPISNKSTVRVELKKLLQTEFLMKNPEGIEAEFLALFSQIENSRDVLSIISTKKKLDELLSEETLPENLKDKYSLVNMHCDKAMHVNNNWEKEISDGYMVYEQLLDGVQSRLILSALKVVHEIKSGNIFDVFRREAFSILDQYKKEAQKLEDDLIRFLKPILEKWIKDYHCNKIEDKTQFESKMRHISDLLLKASFEEEAQLALEHIEIENNKPWLQIEQLKKEYNKLKFAFDNNKVDSSYGYKRLSELRDLCDSILTDLEKYKKYIKEYNEFVSDVTSKKTIAENGKKKLEQELESFDNCLYELDSIDDIRIAGFRINDLQRNNYDEDTDQFLCDISSNFKQILDKLESIIKVKDSRCEFDEIKTDVLIDVNINIDYLRDEYGIDVSEVVIKYIDGIDEKLTQDEKYWENKYLDFNFETATIEDVKLLEIELEVIPKYLSESTIEKVKTIKDSIGDFIDRNRVDAVVESFRNLSDGQRKKCYELLEKFI